MWILCSVQIIDVNITVKNGINNWSFMVHLGLTIIGVFIALKIKYCFIQLIAFER